jgi:secreted protein with Ig-like and vWFA domain
MTTSTFDTNDERLTAYAFGELDDAGRAEVEQHLAASPELQAELAELQNLAGLLRSELAHEPAPALTPDQRSQLAPSATATPAPSPLAESKSKPTRRWTTRRWILAGMEASAAIAFMVIVWPFLPSPHTDSTQPQLSSEELRPRSDSFRSVRFTSENRGKYVDARTPSPASNQAGGESGPSSQMHRVSSSSHKLADDLLSPTAAVPPDNAIQDGPTGLTRDRSIDLSATPSPRTPRTFHFDSLVSNESRNPQSSTPSKANVSGPVGEPVDTDYKIAASGRMSEEGKKKQLVANSSRPAVDDKLVRAQQEQEGAKLADRRNRNEEFKYRRFETVPSPDSQPDPQSNETYESPAENVFLTPAQQPLSTFSIDVDSASYSNIRRFLTQGQLPPANAVRIEEMINYFTYDYPQPKEGEPFSVTADAAPCPWRREHYLARIALKARSIDKAKRPTTNLVFLLDVSGSMQAANKLPLVKQAMTMLAEELSERDRIAIVTYAGDAGVKLASTPGSDQVRIMQSIEALQAGGSTNGAAGINLAYEEALRHFNGEGENRVILCTDGDFNVGVSSDDQLVQLIQQHAKSRVFLSIFGFGMGNLKDAKLEKLADKGNGHYGYIDDLKEARRVFNEELTGTLYTVAKDVKIQVEFNPLTVGAYRLIGYENRALAARDFNDDTKDAGEIGAGHTVTALYEIVPRGQWPKTQAVDPLKYGNATKEAVPVEEPSKANIPAESADDLFTVKLRYKQPTADTSVKTIDYVVDDIAGKNVAPSADFLWAASVASFGMQLKHSPFRGQWSLEDLYETAQGSKGLDVNGRRREFLDLIQAAKRLTTPRTAEPPTP